MLKQLRLNNYQPLLIWQGFAGAAVGAVGNLFGNYLNSKESQRMRDWQTSERLASQDYNTSERVASQQWQDMQRTAQNQFSEDMYNKYQSPEAMVNQYKAAGINPAAAIDKMPSGSINASSGSSGGAPSGTHVGTPGTSAPYQNIGAWADSFKSVADALEALGRAKRTGIETKHYEEMIMEQIRGARLENDFRDLNLDIAKIFAKPMAKAAYEKLAAEIAKTNMDVQVAEKQVDILVHEGQMAKDRAEQFKEELRLNRLKTIAETNELEKRADVHVGEKFLKEEEAKTQKSVRYLNYENAELARLKQDTEKEQPELARSIADLNRSIGALNWFENRYNQFNKDDIWAARNAENKSRVQIAEETANQAQIATEMALTNKRWQVAEHIVGILLNAGATVLVGGKAVKGAKEAVDLYKKSKGKIGFKFD